MQFNSRLVLPQSWFALRIQLIGAFILLALSLFLFAGLEGVGALAPGLVGISLSYGLQLSMSLQMLVQFVISYTTL